MEHTIAVIGAGNGGTAIAAHLAKCGAAVNLCDPFPQYIAGIQETGYIDLTLFGETSRQTMNLVTTDISAAISDAKLLFVVTPSFTHRIIAEQCWEALQDGQIVILNPGRTGGALEFLDIIRTKGCEKTVVIAEAQTLIYSCRKTGACAVEIYGIKKQLDLGAFPACCTQSVLDLLHPYYPQFQAAKSCLQTSLENIGALFHPAPVLLNIGRIEGSGDKFRYYWDGITPSVATLIEAVDQERIAVAAAYGATVPRAVEWLKSSYDTQGDNLYELIQNNAAYSDIQSPDSIECRYVTEDVPMSLVPISELGRIAGVSTPNIDAIITLTSTIYQTNFRRDGRSIENLGLTGMTRSQVTHYFETGEK